MCSIENYKFINVKSQRNLNACRHAACWPKKSRSDLKKAIKTTDDESRGENKCPFPKIYGVGLAFNVILCCAHTFFFYNVPSPSKSHFSNFPFLMKMTVVRGVREKERFACRILLSLSANFSLVQIAKKSWKIKIPNESLWHFISLWQLVGLMVIPQFF